MPSGMRRLNRPRALGVGLLMAAIALVVALWVPIPAVPDAGRATVMSAVSTRLPGWNVERLDPSWEGAYTVVTSCAGRTLSFQFVPGHGLPRRDAWLQPSDEFARSRLRLVSDHWRYLVWYAEPDDIDTLSCSEELARYPLVDLRRATFD